MAPTTSDVKPAAKTASKKDGKKDEEDQLSDEDQLLKNELEMHVEKLKDKKQSAAHKASLETLIKLIRTATSSMTSVPKPLKFLMPHFQVLRDLFETLAQSENKKLLANILSILAMTHPTPTDHLVLHYRFLGTQTPIQEYGHEYVRHLSLEIIHEYANRIEQDKPTDDLLVLAKQIVGFLMKNGAEGDACDLLLEMEQLHLLTEFVDEATFKRVCLYIKSCTNYVTPPDDIAILKTAHKIYRQFSQFSDALLISIRLRDMQMIADDFQSCSDPLLRKQLAFLIARAQINFLDLGTVTDQEEEDLTEIINNTRLSEHFLSLARDLDVMEPKTPEDVYKSHLENIRGRTQTTHDSARHNLASTFVNAFVNAGFGSDKLLVSDSSDSNTWIYKNKEHGMMSATASLGVIQLWGVDTGLPVIDKYLYSAEDHIVAGALLAIGLITSGVRNESEPALALLSEYVGGTAKAGVRAAAIVGLGIAYAGSSKEEIHELLSPLVTDTGLSMEIASLAALSLGMTYNGTTNGDIVSSILQTLMEREPVQLSDKFGKFMGVGLGLMFLGKQECADATLETLKVVEGALGKQIGVLVEVCAYAGTGNVLKIQKMLHYCNDHLDQEKPEDSTFQTFAVIGIAMIAMGEEIGSEMALRSFNHLMHYGELNIRRAVPIAIGLLCVSNPQVHVMEVLSKYSHDHDQGVAQSAIFAMGLIGAGTNNARLAQMLRGLAAYYHKEPNCLFVVRIAQGLLHMGKGTMTLNPFYSNRELMNPVAVAGLLTTVVAFSDKELILGSGHYFLYYLVPAMFPRFLITLDEKLNSLPTTVRVGQAVDTVGQAGRPKTITGFQTHSTPVLLAYTERGELASEEYLALSNVLEGFVILKKNPEWMDEDEGVGK